MSKFDLALKQEICRLTGKQIRGTVGPLKAQVRELRKLVSGLKKALAAELRARGAKAKETPAGGPLLYLGTAEPPAGMRMSPRLVAKLRDRLGLSRAPFAALLGVSAASIALWETGKAKPVGKNRAALAALRKLGLRQVKKLLEQRAPELAGKARRKVRGKKAAGRKAPAAAKAAKPAKPVDGA